VPEPKDILANLVANLIWYALAAATAWLVINARKWRSRPALRARISTRHVIDSLTAIAANLSVDGKRVRDLWRVEYELTNKGRNPVTDLVVSWSVSQADVKVAKVDTLASEFVADEESRTAKLRQLEAKESVRLYVYVDGRKKPTLVFSSGSSVGPAHVEEPRVPEEDVVFYVLGLFALVQAVTSAIGGSTLFAVVGALITGFAFGIPGGFHMVRRWRDQGIDLP
jgi:hypothetical protein